MSRSNQVESSRTRKLFSSRAAIFVGAMVAALFGAPGASVAGPPTDQVNGTGTLSADLGSPTVQVNASADLEDPTTAKGMFRITYPDGTTVRGDVLCISVSGNTAYVIGKITQASGPRADNNTFIVGDFIIIGIMDNGQPGAGQNNPPPDRLNFSRGDLTSQPACAPNGAATPVFDIVRGNFVVFDAP